MPKPEQPPPPPDRNQHAPGISRTLEEGASRARMVERVQKARKKRQEDQSRTQAK